MQRHDNRHILIATGIENTGAKAGKKIVDVNNVGTICA
jgi:hypothetical protein